MIVDDTCSQEDNVKLSSIIMHRLTEALGVCSMLTEHRIGDVVIGDTPLGFNAVKRKNLRHIRLSVP